MSVLFLDYDLLSQIGYGSFSSVYKAKRKSDGTEVAIKIIEVKSENELFFIRNEEKVLKLIMGGHSSIPILYEIFSEGPFYFIVMEFLKDYISLLDWTNSYAPLIFGSNYESEEIQDIVKVREADIIEIFTNIISAINYLHSKSVVHRDLKLDNIMINPNTKSIKIIDYGFSIITETMEWSTICGSFEYLAPEILQDIMKHNIPEEDQSQIYSKYSIQSEVWSIGVILYGMIYCRLPFYHSNKMKLFQMILNSDISFYPEYAIINENLKILLLSMLDKNQLKRIGFEKILQYPLFEKFIQLNADSNRQNSPTISDNLTLSNSHDYHYLSDSFINKSLTNLHTKKDKLDKPENLPLALKKNDLIFSSNEFFPMAYKISIKKISRRMPQYKKRLPPGVTIKKPKI